MSRRIHSGFTLIELLVVIAIIGILASIVLVSLTSARAKGRDAKRLSDLREVSTALELYANDHNGQYPCSGVGGSCSGSTCPNGATYCWLANCTITANWGAGGQGTSGANAWVPNLAPTYMPSLPTDPNPSTNACYLYKSNGTDYMILAYLTVETYTSSNNPEPRPSQPTLPSFAMYTPGAQGW